MLTPSLLLLSLVAAWRAKESKNALQAMRDAKTLGAEGEGGGQRAREGVSRRGWKIELETCSFSQFQ